MSESLISLVPGLPLKYLTINGGPSGWFCLLAASYFTFFLVVQLLSLSRTILSLVTRGLCGLCLVRWLRFSWWNIYADLPPTCPLASALVLCREAPPPPPNQRMHAAYLKARAREAHAVTLAVGVYTKLLDLLDSDAIKAQERTIACFKKYLAMTLRDGATNAARDAESLLAEAKRSLAATADAREGIACRRRAIIRYTNERELSERHLAACLRPVCTPFASRTGTESALHEVGDSEEGSALVAALEGRYAETILRFVYWRSRAEESRIITLAQDGLETAYPALEDARLAQERINRRLMRKPAIDNRARKDSEPDKLTFYNTASTSFDASTQARMCATLHQDAVVAFRRDGAMKKLDSEMTIGTRSRRRTVHSAPAPALVPATASAGNEGSDESEGTLVDFKRA